jgi:hypothetical protein
MPKHLSLGTGPAYRPSNKHESKDNMPPKDTHTPFIRVHQMTTKDAPKKSKHILNASDELRLASRRSEKWSSTFRSSEERRRALAESGVTVVAHIKKDRELVAWAQSMDRAVYIGRNFRGWRGTAWGNPFRPQTHAPEEHDRVIALYERFLDDNPILLARLPELSGGKVLLCWCHPLPCHGDVLARRANANRPRSKCAHFP